jgi:hypothetical protein
MTLYAAYGSNMDPARMRERCPESPHAGSGWIEGWRLTFGGEDISWEGAMTTLVEEPDEAVFVALYDVSPQDEPELDAWEGADRGLHHKIKLMVRTLEGDKLAWLYVLDSYEGGLPSARYLGMIADAAEAAGAPNDYVVALRARPCRAND